MTMHLAGPGLTTTGKRKGKQKFRSAAAAQQARELDKEWQNLTTKWGATNNGRKSKPVVVDLPTIAKPKLRDTGTAPRSLNTWTVGAVSSKQSQHYTGIKIVGIGTLHKSNAVPIFSDQEAIEIATMRR
jgi:hypothetical protein